MEIPTIFADAPFRETLSDFHSVKSADFVLKFKFNIYLKSKLYREFQYTYDIKSNGYKIHVKPSLRAFAHTVRLRVINPCP